MNLPILEYRLFLMKKETMDGQSLISGILANGLICLFLVILIIV